MIYRGLARSAEILPAHIKCLMFQRAVSRFDGIVQPPPTTT